MKVLLADEDSTLRQWERDFLETRFDVSVLEADSVSDAKRIIKDESDLFCVITDYKLKGGTGADVYHYAHGLRSSLPFVLCTETTLASIKEFENVKLAAYIPKPYVIQPIEKLFLRFFPEKKDFFPLSYRVVREIGVFDFDLYVKVSQERYSKATDLTQEQEYYVRRNDISQLVRQLHQTVADVLITRQIDPAHVFPLSTAAHELAHRVVHRLGVTPEALSVIDSGVNLVLGTLQRLPQLHKLILAANKNGEPYLHTHSVLLAYVSCALLMLQGRAAKDKIYTLVSAAFLHDLMVRTRAALYVRSPEKMTPDMMQEYISHPIEAAELAVALPNGSSEIARIIIEHHERPDGSGFPWRVDHTKMASLSPLFIIAEELTHYMMDRGEDWSMAEFVKTHSEKFNVGEFKRIVDVMKQGAV